MEIRRGFSVLLAILLIASLPTTFIYLGYESANPIGKVSAAQGDQVWTHGNTNYGNGAIVVDGWVYGQAKDNQFESWNVYNGSVRWTYNTNANIGKVTASYLDGSVFIGDTLGGVYAVHAENGTEKWAKTGVAGTQINEVSAFDEIVYATSDDNSIYALDANNGSTLWSYSTGDIIRAGPTVEDGNVIFGSNDDFVYSLNAKNGSLNWKYNTTVGIVEGATIKDGVVYIGNTGGNMFALDLNDGSKLWNYSVGSGIYTTPTIAENNLYFGAHNGFYALNLDGTLDWQIQTGDRYDTSPTYANGVIYTQSTNANIYALDAGDGSVIWSKLIGKGTGSTVVYDGIAIWTTDDNAGRYNAYYTGDTAYSEGSRVADRSLTFTDKNLPRPSISGQVKNQNGNPVANATVEAWGYSAPTVAQAKDDLTSLSDPTPAEFTEQLETGFQLTGQSGFFDSQSVEYAAISSAARFPGEGVSYLGTDFGVDPLWRNIEPGQRVVLTSWDPTNPRNSGLENDLPGQTTDTPVVVEQIDALNGTVDRKIYELDQSVTDYGVDWNWRKEVHYNVTSSLTTGYYRVYPKGHVESAYFVEVGDPGLTIEQLRSAIDDALTPKAQEVVNGLASGDLVRQRVVTNAQGEFSVSLSPSLKAVHLQAYKRPERLENIAREDLSLTDIRNFTEDGYNGSVVLPSRPVTVEPPDSSVELRVGEFSLPSYTPLNRSELKQKWLDEFLSNLNYSDLNGVLQNSPGNFTREELERLNQRLQQLVSQNDQLRNRFRDLCGEEYRLNDDTCDIVVESSNATTEELRTRIDDLSTTLDGLRETIESGTGEFTRGNETISWTKPFGTELDPENVLVLIHYTNGTTDTLTTDSPYVSIDSRLGRGDQVVIDQLPLGDAAGAGIEVIVANQDGIGSARRSVTNPAFSGEVPGIESLAFSSLNPGPSESVTLDLNPTEDSSIQNLSSITVYGPDGSTVPASVTGRNHASFDTDGKGIYQVRAQFQDLDGNNFTLVQRLKAGDLDVKLPPGIRAESTPYGTIAVVGDGLEGGSVDVQDGGASIRLVAQAPSSSEIPSEVHAYTETLSLLSNHRTTVSVVQGDEQSSVGKHVATVLHEPAVDPSGEGLTNFAPLFYRNDAPLPTGSSEKGIVDLNESRTRIETYTDSNGQVTIRTIEEPGIIQWARYQADSIDIPFL